MTFTAAGASQKITVRGFDAAGREVTLPTLRFTSSNPAFASVAADGVVRPQAELGSALIDVRAGDILASPVTVLAIRAAPGVTLVDDAQIVSAPTPIAGSRHAQVTLRGTPMLALGARLIGTGGVPLGGRVVAARAGTDTTTLDIEDVPITELVTDMDLRLSFTPAQVNAGLPAGPYRAGGTSTMTRALRVTPNALRISNFDCELEGDASAVQGALEGTLTLAGIGFDVVQVVTASQRRATTVLARGELKASLKGVLSLGAIVTGGVECKARLLRIVAPVFGLASLVAAPTLPVDAKFALSGAVSVAGFSFGANDELTATADIGFVHVEGSEATVHHDFDVSNTLEPVATVPNGQGPRAKVKVFAGLGSGLDVGVGNLGALSLAELELLTLHAGPEFELRVAGPYTAAADAGFQTGYDLKAKLVIAPGEDVQELIESLLPPGVPLDLSFERETPLAASPQTSQLLIDKDIFAVGDTLKFTIDFDAGDLRFLGWNYNLKQLRVYRIDNDTLTATEVARADAAAGQMHFELTAVAALGGTAVGADGKPTFVAYLVDVPLLGVSDAWPFELGPLVSNVQTEQRLAAASAASLVLRDDGRVVIRGTNSGGALGLGMPIGLQSEATVIPSLVNVKAVSGSNWAGAALLQNGQVWAWGWGDCVGLPQQNNPLPVLIDDNVGSRNVAISSGYGHSLILKADGSVWRFGGGRNRPKVDTGLGPATAIAAGNTFDIALRADGSVWTVGQGSRGQLGNGQLGNSATPVTLHGIDDAVAIAAGDSFGLFLRRNGQVWSWGEGLSGQLGNGGLVDSAIPHPVEGLVNVSRIAAGEHHGMALANGVVYTWGFNGSGQLGTGDTANRRYPVQVLTGVRDIDGGEYNSLAALADGTVMGWGLNNDGQIGNNRTNNPITRPSDTLMRVGPR